MVALEAGCFSCHSDSSHTSHPNPVLRGESGLVHEIPSMFGDRLSLSELRQWIEEGISSEKKASRAHMEARQNRLLQMPSFKDHLSSAEIEDLMAYLALSQYSISSEGTPVAATGESLARRFSCFSCHGEMGQGGVKNPGSLKGYIPGFFGQDFRALTRNGELEDIMEWIENGASDAFLNQGFLGFYPGRFFAERQVIKMPAYKALLSPEEIEILAEFLLEILEKGPLTAEGILQYRPISAVVESRPSKIVPDLSTGGLFSESAAILTRNCLECHGPQKQRSGYRLDLESTALKGGEIADFLEVAAIVPGDSGASLLIKFVEAAEEDLANEIYPMPPDENPRLSDDEIRVLRSWIDRGARWPTGHQIRSESE